MGFQRYNKSFRLGLKSWVKALDCMKWMFINLKVASANHWLSCVVLLRHKIWLKSWIEENIKKLKFSWSHKGYQWWYGIKRKNIEIIQRIICRVGSTYHLHRFIKNFYKYHKFDCFQADICFMGVYESIRQSWFIWSNFSTRNVL